jgi:hypothetical protein
MLPTECEWNLQHVPFDEVTTLELNRCFPISQRRALRWTCSVATSHVYVSLSKELPQPRRSLDHRPSRATSRNRHPLTDHKTSCWACAVSLQLPRPGWGHDRQMDRIYLSGLELVRIRMQQYTTHQPRYRSSASLY